MENELQIIKGNIVFTPVFGQLTVLPNGYIIVEGKTVTGVYAELPEQYPNSLLVDYHQALIMPGFVDLHLHAPQFVNRGIGLDLELLPWLERYTFPAEARFQDITYAEAVYKQVVKQLWKWGTTRAVLFGTIHKEATVKLMELVAQAGLGGYVGKVNMDRNAPDYLRETTSQSLADTEEFIAATIDRYEQVKPILTPRFVPTCSGELLRGIARLAAQYNLPVQSHLAENEREVAWVKELQPECPHYAGVYHTAGLFGQQPTIMAHCIYNTAAELALMAAQQVVAAHCPYSNTNLASGIAPVRNMLAQGIRVGLGSDVAGGHEVAMSRVLTMAIQVSKLRWLASGRQESFLTIPEALFLATKGGGSFFGKVGSFEAGYEFDALVIDDSSLAVEPDSKASVAERLSRFLYIGDYSQIIARYVAGKKIEQPDW